MRCHAGVSSVFGLLALISCGGGTSGPEPPCPPSDGEFPPTDCAVLRGYALATEGDPLAGLTLRVDSMIPGKGFVYTSENAVTGDDGAFELMVLRVNRFEPPTAPDTATLAVAAYEDPGPRPLDPTTARTNVRVRFSPVESPTPVTEDTLVFDLHE